MIFKLNDLISKYNLKIKGIIHIGAHYGEEIDSYERNGVQNLVFFEPLEKNYKVLETVVDGKYPLFNYALGNDNCEVEMFVESVNSGMSSSILEPLTVKKQYPNIIFDKKEKVQMKRLDDIGIELEKYNFINIDVQGYELEVFKGSTNTLQYIDYIITEINRDELYKGCPHVNELSDFLRKFGFVLLEQSWVGNTWGDGFYIKNYNYDN